MKLRLNCSKKVFFCLSFYLIGVQAFNKYGIALEKLRSCKEQLVSGEYGYHDFFHIKTLNHTKLGKDETLHLKLFVSTESDAHVLLSVNSEPFLFSNRDYEFVICGWANKRSVLRLKYKEGTEIAVSDNDRYLLNHFDITPIEIIQTRHGRISVFIPGYKDEPILDYHDPVPFDVNYLSFGTYGGYKGRWLYDCDLDGEDQEQHYSATLSNKKKQVLNFPQKKPSEPLCLDSAYFQFNMNVMTTELNQSMMKGRLNFFVNSTGSHVVLGNNIDLTTVCVRNLQSCPASAFACQISDIDIKPIDDVQNNLNIRAMP